MKTLLKALRIVAGEDAFLSWLTPKFQADWKERGAPLLAKGLEEGALSTKDYGTITSILGKANDGMRNKLRTMLKKAEIISDRGEWFEKQGIKPDADGTMSREAWDKWSEYSETADYRAYEELRSFYGSPYNEKDRAKRLAQLNEYKGKAKNKVVQESLDYAIKMFDDFSDLAQQLSKIEVLEASKMKYRPKQAKQGSLRAVQDVLIKAMEQVRDAHEKEWTGIILGWAESWLEARRQDPKLRLSKYFKGQKAAMTAGLLNPDYTALRDDATKIAEQKAKSVVKGMQDMFVGKNMGKLTPIIEGRGDFKSAESRGVHNKHGAFEGSILINFVDGASFIALTKLVWGMNQHGTSYSQYPTTFHDISAPGLEPKKFAPEEWMNETFAKRAQT
jgi:hypothetical protein